MYRIRRDTIPEYSYHCEACNHHFTVVRSIDKYKSKVKCPTFKKQKNVFRNFEEDAIYSAIRLTLGEIKTVGHYAERQTEMKSEEELQEMRTKFNQYRNEEPERELPKGMKKKKLSNKKIIFDKDTNIKITKEEDKRTQERAKIAKQRKQKK